MHKIMRVWNGINFGVLRKIGMLSLLSLAMIYAAHMVTEDRLLFQSDAYSLSIYLGGMTLFFTSIFCIPIALLIPKRLSKRAYKMVIIAIIAMMGFCFLYWIEIIRYLIATFIIIRYLLTKIKDPLLLLVITPIVLFFTIMIFYFFGKIPFHEIVSIILIEWLLFRLFAKYFHYHLIKSKLEKIGICLLIVLTIVPLLIAVNFLKRSSFDKPNSTEKKHLVIIVLDALPTALLHRYNPKSEPTAFDAIFDNNLLFKNFYTSSPYTYGFFGTLYNGVICSKETACATDNNIIRQLQKNDVSVRNMAWHKMATPEGSAIESNNYDGLRSFFLNEYSVLIPKMLGLDYHIMLKNIGVKSLKKGRDNHHASYPDQGFFVDQISENMHNSDKSLTIITTRWSSFVAKDWSNYDFTLKEMDDFRRKTDDWQYDVTKYGDYVAKIREDSKKHLSHLANQFQLFLNKINQLKNKDDITILLTSDHGKVMRGGRYDYVWHPQEGNIHNTLAIIGGDKKGVDERFINVLDLNNSILDFFGVNEDKNNHKPSIFNHKNTNEYVTTLTANSKKHKEWFLIISGLPEGKYQANFHPDGNGSLELIKLNHFDESNVEKLQIIPEKIRTIINKSLTQDYLIKPSDIHSRFKI